MVPVFIATALQPLTVFAATCKAGGFFGLIPWYEYINDGAHFSGCTVTKFTIFPDGAGNSSDVPLVLLAIVDDLLRVAGMVAVVFVIVGAVGFITSQGNPEAAAKARNTIVNALIGMAIAIIAASVVSFIGNKLG